MAITFIHIWRLGPTSQWRIAISGGWSNDSRRTPIDVHISCEILVPGWVDFQWSKRPVYLIRGVARRKMVEASQAYPQSPYLWATRPSAEFGYLDVSAVPGEHKNVLFLIQSDDSVLQQDDHCCFVSMAGKGHCYHLGEMRILYFHWGSKRYLDTPLPFSHRALSHEVASNGNVNCK